MTKDLLHYKELLLTERKKLRNTLEGLGHVHTDDEYDFDASAEEEQTVEADESDRASEIENFSTRVILEAELEKRYQEIHAALDAMTEGTYGICRFCRKEIPDERLEANPAARTCMLHAELLNDSSSRL